MAQTTQLDAVNTMLSAIGEAPVNSLSSGLVEAEIAETVLNTVDREVQSMGWHFNTELKKTFAPSTANNILLGADILRADAHLEPNSPDLVQRGNKMYDRKNHTFTISANVSLDVVVQLNFDDLPEVCRAAAATAAMSPLFSFSTTAPAPSSGPTSPSAILSLS